VQGRVRLEASDLGGGIDRRVRVPAQAPEANLSPELFKVPCSLSFLSAQIRFGSLILSTQCSYLLIEAATTLAETHNFDVQVIS
jgi:hypothetical protein